MLLIIIQNQLSRDSAKELIIQCLPSHCELRNFYIKLIIPGFKLKTVSKVPISEYSELTDFIFLKIKRLIYNINMNNYL